MSPQDLKAATFSELIAEQRRLEALIAQLERGVSKVSVIEAARDAWASIEKEMGDRTIDVGGEPPDDFEPDGPIGTPFFRDE